MSPDGGNGGGGTPWMSGVVKRVTLPPPLSLFLPLQSLMGHW